MRSATVAAIWMLLAAAAQAQTTVTAQDPYEAPTQAERFHHYLHSTFNAESLVRAAAGAAILQWSDTPTEWGQGATGYARRYGNSYAQHIMRQTILYGASDLLHEDNTWRPSRRKSVSGRLGYAVESTFLARKDDGHRSLSYSRIAAVVGTAFISREWQPHTTNGAQNAVHSIETTFAAEVAFNIAREFLPRIFARH